MIETIQWTDDGVVMIDQTRLPLEERYVTCRTLSRCGGRHSHHGDPGRAGHWRGRGHGRRAGHAAGAALRRRVRPHLRDAGATRPTAVNLFWAIDRMRRRVPREMRTSRSRTSAAG